MNYLNKYYKKYDPLRLDLGSGLYPKEGFVGIDNFIGIKSQTLTPESVDKSELNVLQHDLSEGIPFETNSVDEIVTSHFLEHCNFLDKIFEEMHRVLKNNCKLEILVPYANSAEGTYPGHNIFFTEKWFEENLVFNKLFDIKEFIFHESEYYSQYKRKINKIFTFDEARLFLFNCCHQMQIIAVCKKDNMTDKPLKSDIKYSSVNNHGFIRKVINKVGIKLSYR